MADNLGFFFHNRELAIFGVITEGHHTADPEPLAFGRPDLVPNTLGRDLPFKLGKGQKDVQGQAAHRGRGVELLGHRDEGHAVSIE
jgi:hypothetical protein